MTDISKTIEAKSDQLNADDLIGTSKILKITGLKMVTGDQPVAISYEGDNGKPWKPCKAMRRVLIAAWGTNGDDYVGKYVKVFNDSTVKWAGQEVGGIRISAMSDLHGPLKIAIAIAKGKRVPYCVDVLEVPKAKTLEQQQEDCITAIINKGFTVSEEVKMRIGAAQNKAELSTIYKEVIT